MRSPGYGLAHAAGLIHGLARVSLDRVGLGLFPRWTCLRRSPGVFLSHAVRIGRTRCGVPLIFAVDGIASQLPLIRVRLTSPKRGDHYPDGHRDRDQGSSTTQTQESHIPEPQPGSRVK